MNFIFDPSLVLYLPLHQLDGSSSMSKDAYGHVCTVTGAVWTSEGRLFDGVDDYININGILTPCANLTQGTVSVWVRITDEGGDNVILSISNNASATETQFNLWTNQGSAHLLAEVKPDGTSQWRFNTATNSLVPYYNSWLFVTVVHDGVAPVLYFNGNREDVTFPVTTDKTKWLKAVITDATVKADTASIGAFRNNGSPLAFWQDKIGELYIHGHPLTPQEIQHNYLTTKWRYK